MACMDKITCVLPALPAEALLAPGTDDQEIATAYIVVVLLEPLVLTLESEPPC
jgi:hypothetical protein